MLMVLGWFPWEGSSAADADDAGLVSALGKAQCS